MADFTDEVLDEYGALVSGSARPETEEEKEAAAELKERRDAWLANEAARLGYKSGNVLDKALMKALRKREKKLDKGKKPESKNDAKKKKISSHDGTAASKENDEVDDTTDFARLREDLEEHMRKTLGFPDKNLGRGHFHVNTPELLAKHLEATGGKWMLRFPPEPNGFLHIGHAKAMSVNFGTAGANGGNCYLRFDDTNPGAEKQEYIDAIIENVHWMGYTPFKVTYTSDYFDELFVLACELIRRGKAYVCLMKPDDVKAQREALRIYHSTVANDASVEFPVEALKDEGRDRSPEENLELFLKMKEGRFDEGEATLRMKGDFHSKNPNMWDHMAYRIMYKAHHRTGDKWCIFPTYDFSHCLVDSIENITHSLCTLEFETRQSPEGSYHWLLWALDLYHPMTWESSRCSIAGNVMSKRRLHRLVDEKKVIGWDDPRLLTLAGLRRRGYTPSAIRNFCTSLGVARTSNEVCVSFNLLEWCIRTELDKNAPRRLAVIDPIKVEIINFDDPAMEAPMKVTVPNHPGKGREDMGSREVPLTKTIFIPGEKFRLDMVKGYKGMVPGSSKNLSVKLLNARIITYKSHEMDEASGRVKLVKVELEPSDAPYKGMNTIAWVPENAFPVESRLYGRLFKDCEVDGVEVNAEKAAKEKNVDFMELFNEDSLQTESILVEPGIKNELEVKGLNVPRFQFITLGYFCPDMVDSTTEKPVFNLIVSLKEDKTKANIK